MEGADLEDIHVSRVQEGIRSSDSSLVRDEPPPTEKKKRKKAKATDAERANIFSRISFWWINPLLVLGKQNKLDESQLQLLRTEKAQVAYTHFMKYWTEELKKDNPSLFRALLVCYWKEFLKAAIWKLLWGIFVLISAFYFVRTLVDFVEEKDNHTDWEYKSGFIIAAAFFVCCMFLSISLQQMSSKCSALGIRMRAALLTAVYQKAIRVDGVASNVGDVLNLVTNDCSRLLDGVTHAHYLWSGPLESIAIIILLLVLVGRAALVGLGLMLLMIPFLYFTGNRVAKIRKKQILITDKRVQILHEVLLAIKLVKFYAWEKSFADEIEKMRKSEVKLLRKSSFIKTINLMLVFITPPLMALGIFGVYIVITGSLKPTIAFTTLSLFNTLRFPLVKLPEALKSFIESRSAITRIQHFLMKKEWEAMPKSDVVGVFAHNASFAYGESQQPSLENVTFSLSEGQKLAIVGPLGGGKSTLICGILGEARTISGNLQVGGRLAYVPQTPWIQHATVRENILFGLEYEKEKYDRVTFACALSRDFEILAEGDLTEIGERGINLSGGQKQRIALARAVYSNADIYLLDNPLSAVDQHTTKHIMDHCVNSELEGKIVIMVTHHLQLLHAFDTVSYIKNHKMEYYGPYTKDFLPTYFSNLADEVSEDHVEKPHHDAKEKNDKAPTQAKKEKAKAEVDPSTVGNSATAFNQWFKAAGRPYFAGAVAVAAVTQVTRIISDWWISQWTNDHFGHSQRWYLTIYGCLVFSFFVFLLCRGATFYGVNRRAATRLHNRMFRRIIRAPLTFFTITPLGRVLNSFSRDQDIVDETLPDTTMMLLIYTCILLTTLVLVCQVLPYYSIVAAVLLGSFFYLQLYYIRSSKLMKSLASSTNSPIFAHVSESLQGIAVVRAFGAQARFEHDNMARVDRNSKATYNLDHIQLWLAFRLDTIGSLLVFATSIFCIVSDDITASGAGLAISSTIQKLVFFSWVVRSFSEAQSQVNSAERLTYFGKQTEQEAAAIIENSRPADNWPTRGEVRYEHVKMSYFTNAKPALHDVSFQIRPNEKVGVVGRTGSGKSSLIIALFRLCEPGGNVFVDETNTRQYGLSDLRSHLAIIPQEPVLFKGTVRSNLDPFGKYSDLELWDALALAHLKDTVSEYTSKLEAPVSENGDNFSLGQKQLFCLSRAILNKSKVLVLDEATAAMDLETDSLIRHTIRKVFADRTVITIAHRLDTIIDSDRILVMDAGHVLEFDTPATLLNDPNSSFSNLVEQCGSSAQALRATAIAHAEGRDS